MDPQTVFYGIGALALGVIAGSFVFIAYHTVRTLTLLRKTMETIYETTNDVAQLKNSLKSGAYRLANSFFGKSDKRGGDRNDEE